MDANTFIETSAATTIAIEPWIYKGALWLALLIALLLLLIIVMLTRLNRRLLALETRLETLSRHLYDFNLFDTFTKAQNPGEKNKAN